MQRRIVHHDKAADHHYDTISAWIKATRGSDPDASLYYLAILPFLRALARGSELVGAHRLGRLDSVLTALVIALVAAPSSRSAS